MLLLFGVAICMSLAVERGVSSKRMDFFVDGGVDDANAAAAAAAAAGEEDENMAEVNVPRADDEAIFCSLTRENSRTARCKIYVNIKKKIIQ